MNGKKIAAVHFIIVAVIGVCCNKVAKSDSDAESSIRSVRVTMGAVIRDSIALPLPFPGKLATAKEMKLGFKTGGIIREIDAVEGVNVPKGRKIARLDTVELVAWRNKARVGVEKALRDLERVKKLYSDSVATLEQLQNAQSVFTAAQSDLEIASFNLSQAVLVAPTSGKILRRLTEKNEVVGPGMPVVVFASTDGKWVVKSSVPDRDLSVIAIGDSAAVMFDALPQKVFTAILVRIAGAAHPVTGTFEIECALQKTHSRFRPGLIADIRLYPQQQKKVVFIPARALVNGTGKQGTVYTVGSNDSIVALQVTVERIFDDLLAVSSGLENVDSIIINGAEYVWYSTGPIVIERN